MLWFYFVLALVVLIYLNSGFRFRIVLLVISLTTIYYLTKQSRPNLLLWSVAGLAFILLMGVMEYSRSYEKGLNLQRIEDKIHQNCSRVEQTRRVYLWLAVPLWVRRKRMGIMYISHQ